MASDSFELLSDSGPTDANQCGRHLRVVFTTHPVLFCFVFISILTLDLAECTNDWLLLKDVLFLEQGLVFGPLKRMVVMILALACAIGSLAIVFEILNISREFLTGKPWVDLDLCSAIVVWLNEVPTLAVNFVISLCHNEPVSYFQLTKALIVILSVILRVIVPLVRTFLQKKEIADSVPKFRKSVYKCFNTIGLCLVLCGASSVFIFLHVVAAEEGKFRFRMPDEIWGGQLAYDRYFKDVAIYYRHKGIVSEDGEDYWLRLANIEEFLAEDTINVKVAMTKRDSVFQKIVVNSYNFTDERYRECYTYEHANAGRYQYTIKPCVFDFIPPNSPQEQIIFRFDFKKPQNRLILGDILYNAKFHRQNVCYNLIGNNTDLLLNQTNTGKPTQIGSLLYLKSSLHLVSTYRLVLSSATTNQTTVPGLYNTNHTLLGADDIWHTGLYGCECTGKDGPSFHANVHLTC